MAADDRILAYDEIEYLEYYYLLVSFPTLCARHAEIF